MNTKNRTDRIPKRQHSPLYASPWIALFLLLRREWAQPRARS
jgi:hypothetical protein